MSARLTRRTPRAQARARLAACGLFALLLGWGAAAAAAAEPAGYVQRPSWQETMRASREALMRREADARRQADRARANDEALRRFQPAEGEISRGEEPRRVKVRVSGLKRLCLGADAPDGGDWCWFAEARLEDRDGRSVPLAPRRPMMTQRRGGFRYEDGRRRQLRLGKRTFKNAFGFRQGEAVYELGGKYEWFEAWVGLRETRGERRTSFWVDCRSRVADRERAEENRRQIRERIRRDFADPVLVREQMLEEQDGLWQRDWPVGDVKGLARRYAGACGGEEKKAASLLAASAKGAEDLAGVRSLYYLGRARQRLDWVRRTLAFVQRSAPRPRMAKELADLERQIAQPASPSADGRKLHARLIALRRRIILSHPLLDFDRLLINKRTCHLPGHMCDQYLGRHSRPGPGLVVLESWKDQPTERPLLEGKLPPGAVLHPDLSFDGERVLFSYCEPTRSRNSRERAYFVYEVGVDGGAVRQVTGTGADPMLGADGRRTVLIEDLDPCYLPDGGFAFVSTRSQQFGRCHGSRYVPSYVTYRAEADGSGIRRLSCNEANEWDPAVLNDGRIIYTRWDYINRHDTNFQSLWVMHPDGTATAHFYGNYSVGPCMIAEARPIPNSRKVVATATDHHGYTAGSILVIDPAVGQDGGEPLLCVTPEVPWPERGAPRETTMAPRPSPEDIPPTAPRQRRRCATPLALSEDLFLVAYTHGQRYAIYLVDTLGGRELIYRADDISCFSPIPIVARPTPPVLPSTVAAGDAKVTTGRFFVRDVYRSTQPIERGTIKRMRISRILPQPTRSKPILSYVNNEIIKRILGTVPVHPDGSAAFEAPADTPLQFQLLDANGMAVMTMRSLVYVQPGESISCVGCHEPRKSSPVIEPVVGGGRFVRITPPDGPRYAGGFSFVRTVQPVLDRYCIGCHGLEKTEAQVNLLGTPGSGRSDSRHGSYFNAAYHSLMRRGRMVRIAQRNSETAYSKPKDYFAHAGKLAPMLLAGHKDKEGKPRVQLDRASFQRIVDWLDLNAQYYGDYSFNRPEALPPVAEAEKALRAHVAKVFGAELAKQPFAALVNVAMPEESRILKAPLAVAAGGWGQIRKGGWAGTKDAGYRKMRELVLATLSRPKYHDLRGTCGRDHCRCGCCWVRQLWEVRRMANQP